MPMSIASTVDARGAVEAVFEDLEATADRLLEVLMVHGAVRRRAVQARRAGSGERAPAPGAVRVANTIGRWSCCSVEMP